MTKTIFVIDGEEVPVDPVRGVHPNDFFAQMAAVKFALQNAQLVAKVNRWWMRPVLRLCRIRITMPWGNVVLGPLRKAVFLDELKKARQMATRNQ